MSWYKSQEQPLCRCCGKPIRKHTNTVYVRDEAKRKETMFSSDRYVHLPPDRFPKSRAECQKLVNEQVVSVCYHPVFAEGEPCGREIWSFGTWDGESWDDEFFCTGECAKTFGYIQAKVSPMQTKAYGEAKRKRKEKVT